MVLFLATITLEDQQFRAVFKSVPEFLQKEAQEVTIEKILNNRELLSEKADEILDRKQCYKTAMFSNVTANLNRAITLISTFLMLKIWQH